jgi:hypothetical protein
MAQRIENFEVTIPSGTAIAAPQTTNLDFNDGIVERMEVLIPRGPSGRVGFRILHSGDAVIPYDRTKWLIADDEVIKWDLENYPTGSAWAVQAYNIGAYDHTLYFRLLVRETPRATFQRAQLVYIAPSATAEDNLPAV